MDEIYLKKLAERAKQDDTLLDKLQEDVRERIQLILKEWRGQKTVQSGHLRRKNSNNKLKN